MDEPDFSRALVKNLLAAPSISEDLTESEVIVTVFRIVYCIQYHIHRFASTPIRACSAYSSPCFISSFIVSIEIHSHSVCLYETWLYTARIPENGFSL